MGNEELNELPEELMEYFCEQVLKRDWPNSIPIYNFIKNALQWKQKNSESNFKLLYNPDDVENGTFIGIISRLKKEYCDNIVIYTSPAGNVEQLRRIVCCTEYIKWPNDLMFLAISNDLTNTVKSKIEDNGFEVHTDDVWVHWMAADKAAKLTYEVPEDFYIDRLTMDHTDLVHSLWLYNKFISKSELGNVLNYNISMGVFSRKNDDTKPVAWIMLGINGELGNLYVLPEFRKRGFGKLVTIAISKAMGIAGISPHLFVVDGNLASLKLFECIGFVKNPTSRKCLSYKNSSVHSGS